MRLAEGAMFITVSDPELSFADISDYCAAEIHLPQHKIQALLEGAFWLGEISGEPTLTRLELLKRLFKWMRNCDAPSIVFIAPEDTPPNETTELDDGSLIMDLRPKVLVPSLDPETWSEQSCKPAFETLAKTPSLEHYPEWSPGFAARKLTIDEFFKFVSSPGYDFPKFWKSPTGKASSPKPAPDQLITNEVRCVYDLADKNGAKPPNIKEIAKPVQCRLKELGYSASATQIQTIADRPEFKKRRRPQGKTLKSEKRLPSK
jgi:hypothetical protein